MGVVSVFSVVKKLSWGTTFFSASTVLWPWQSVLVCWVCWILAGTPRSRPLPNCKKTQNAVYNTGCVVLIIVRRPIFEKNPVLEQEGSCVQWIDDNSGFTLLQSGSCFNSPWKWCGHGINIAGLSSTRWGSSTTVLPYYVWCLCVFVGSLTFLACPVETISDFYPIFFDPTLDYVHYIRCYYEVVYPL